MPTCFVPGCRSGYRYPFLKAQKECNKEAPIIPTNRHFFKVRPVNVSEWKKLIPRFDKPLTEKCSICDLHFEEQYILKQFCYIINGEKVNIEREKWRLTDDAKPTKFPNLPNYLSKSVAKKRSSPQKQKLKCTKFAQNKRSQVLSPDKDECALGSTDVIDSLTETAQTTLSKGGTNVSSCEEDITEISSTDGLQTKNAYLDNLKKKTYYYGKKIKRAKEKEKNLKTTIATLKNKLFVLSQEQSLGKANLSKLPKRQQQIVSHMLRATNCNSVHAMRYDSEWIMDCAVLWNRSASIYDFLRQNKYVPLPNRTTLGKYIRNLEAKFGLGHELFSRLKEELVVTPDTAFQPEST